MRRNPAACWRTVAANFKLMTSQELLILSVSAGNGHVRAAQALAANAGRVLTQRQLLREVWGPSHSGQSHYLRIYMGHLRQKLEADPAQPRHLLTETAVGYRLVI